MLFSLEYLPEAERTIETRYPLANGDAFKAVNAAVFYAIGRNNSGRRIEFEAVDGGTLYYVNSAGLVVQIFVLYVSECVALTRFHFIGVYVMPGGQSPQQAVLRKEVTATLRRLVSTIDRAVEGLLRLGTTEQDMKPPLPSANDLELAFKWQQMYYPEMTDKELAARLGVSHQTIRNARSQKHYTKRTPRGKNRG